jgi:CheY-like chemotaxis protein
MSTDNEKKSNPAAANRIDGVRLLVVDDSEINLTLAKRLLENGGAQVQCLSNGQEAVDWLAQPQNTVDVVLMDVHMPVLDGIGAVRVIRAGQRGAQLPVIAMTAADSDEEIATATEAGMTDHVLKPFSLRTLVEAVLRHVKPVAQPAPSAGAVIQPTETDATDWPDLAGVATDQAKYRYLGERAAFLKQLRRLLEEFSNLEQPPQVPQDPQGWHAMAMRMHKLVGNAGLLAAEPLASAAREAERLAKANTAEGLAAVLQQVSERLIALRTAAQKHLSEQTEGGNAQNGEASGVFSIPADELNALVQDLDDQKFSAAKSYAKLEKQLSTALGPVKADQLKNAMDELDFEVALALLRPLVTA